MERANAVAGTVTLSLDDEAVTTLARWGAKRSQPQWPAILRGIPPESITARMQPGDRIDISASGLPPLVLRPSVGANGALDLQARVEAKNLAAILNVANVAAPFVNRIVAQVLNERIAGVQRDLAAQGLQLRLLAVHTSEGMLTLTAVIEAAA
jgi:hypothetical protein